MPTAWEIAEQRKVLCAILHVDTTTIAWAFGLRNLIVPGPIIAVAGMPYDHARNSACMKALEMGAEWLAFLDSDVIPPPDAFLRLMSHNQPLISGVYFRRSPPHGIPVMLKRYGGPDGPAAWVQNLPPSGLMEVDLVGCGCMMIHRSVLENLPAIEPGHHWFCWRVDRHGVLPPEDCLSEDFAFNRHCQKHGYKIYVDCSVRCKHVGFAQAGPNVGQFTPCEVAT